MADINRQPRLDQAAADGSITGARHRAVEPVPIVAESADVATLDSVDDVLPVPVPGVRRRLTPRPVPGNKRKKPPVLGPAADEEPTPAEEMDDVGTPDDKAAKAVDAEKAVTPLGKETEETPAGGRTATATKAAKPKTAAEIVAAQKAREKAAAEAAAGAADDETSVTKPLVRQPAAASTPTTGTTATGAAGNKPVVKKAVPAKPAPKGKLSTVGSGVRKARNLIASVVWLIAVLAAAVLALGALFTALDQTNQSNEIVRFVLERGHDVVGPFKDLFRLETAKNTLLVNWGIAALVYLIAGKILERFIRP
ncbi:hypothetical protein [Kribbella sp. NPDC006257]|uniref:hypothetical protein n=1 Tax=Kribbella sp. NPDC006257 TaxID=3156738 RepID=UPI0033ADACBF